MKSSSRDISRVLLLASFLLVSCMSAPLQVVTVDGSCKTSSVIATYVSAQPISQSGSSCPVLGLIDCSSEGNGGTVFNSVLETSFLPNSRGKEVDLSILSRATK